MDTTSPLLGNSLAAITEERDVNVLDASILTLRLEANVDHEVPSSPDVYKTSNIKNALDDPKNG